MLRVQLRSRKDLRPRPHEKLLDRHWRVTGIAPTHQLKSQATRQLLAHLQASQAALFFFSEFLQLLILHSPNWLHSGQGFTVELGRLGGDLRHGFNHFFYRTQKTVKSICRFIRKQQATLAHSPQKLAHRMIRLR